jgi:hypothetical protein
MSSLLAALCIISCSPNSNNDPVPDPVDNKPKDTLLSKEVIWDAADPNDIPTTVEYIFDDQKRVKLVVYYDSDTNGIKRPGVKTDTSLQCFYNGNDKNAFRTIGWMIFTSFSAELFHFYNSNNQIIKDSISYGKGYGTRVYTYAQDKLTTFDSQLPGSLPPSYSRDTFLITNNNISTAIFTRIPGASGCNIFTMTYDNKINPLYKLNIAQLKTIEGNKAFDKFPLMSPGYCKNNITQRLSKRKDYSTAGTDTYQYIYNENDLPLYCKLISTFYNTSDGRLKYIYTH